jgi:hypothetical protein
VYKPAASAIQIVAAPPPPPPVALAVPPAPPPPAPPPSVARPAEPTRPAPQIARVSHDAEEDADTPIGDWQTERKGTVRIGKCGKALCGYVLNSSSSDKGEAVLINMKPKNDRQWNRQRLQPCRRRHLLRHHRPQGRQHAARRSLRVRTILLFGQQLEPDHRTGRKPDVVAADSRRAAVIAR